MKTPDELIHGAFQAASKAGSSGWLNCVDRDEDEDHTLLCDTLALAINRRDSEHEQAAQQQVAEARAAAFGEAAGIVRERARLSTTPWVLLGTADAIEEEAKR